MSLVVVSCSLVEPVPEDRFTFCTADVGQGLSQFGIRNGKAVVWDMGPGNKYSQWQNAYISLGRPSVEIVFISHSDEDHLGGLSGLDADFDWSGRLVTSPFEDTAKIRSRSGEWSENIRFEFCFQNDTLRLLDSVLIICLWPPEEIGVPLPLDGADRNRYSLVFMVEHGADRVLITSDIDSWAQRRIAKEYTNSLSAQVMIAPHHGSAGSVYSTFFGYVAPSLAVFSCGEDNPYGHPSEEMMNQFLLQGIDMLFTFVQGNVVLESNGYYWGRGNAGMGE
ncbi:MAG: ComEC/Rec2 family competence protein [Chitinispirillaceae bacterium]